LALIGDVTSKCCLAVAKEAKADNLPMITPSGTSEDITAVGDNVFRACCIDPYQGQLMASYAAKRLGAKTAAILYDSGDDYSTGIANAFKSTAESLGLTITDKESYYTGSTDFTQQLSNIKNSNPDVIMIPVYYHDIAQIAVQAKQLGITSKLLGTDGWDGVLEKIGSSNVSALVNAYFCNQYSAFSTNLALQDFIKTYKQTYGRDANMFSMLGYDAMQIMADAIKRAGSTDSAAIIKALKTTNYTSLSGTITFDANRNPVREAIILSFSDNSYRVADKYSME
jgi:branched-chain amino acid transport system substrate-binding protein